MGRCDVVVVESVAQAKVECGELMLAEDRGTFQWSQAVEMRHLVLGLAGMRPGPEAITLFDGLGVAMEDTAAAGVVLRKAKERGIGTELPIEVRSTAGRSGAVGGGRWPSVRGALRQAQGERAGGRATTRVAPTEGGAGGPSTGSG